MARKHAYNDISAAVKKLSEKISALQNYDQPTREAVVPSIRQYAASLEVMGIHIRIDSSLGHPLEP